jgi:hypothetical protein
MKSREDKGRLDDELRRAINTTRPEFNAEAWKHKYREEFDALQARAGGMMPVRRNLLASWTELGVAAVLTVAVGYGLACWIGHYGTTAARPPVAAKHPAQIVTMLSLSSAFRQGGMEALNKQLDDAVEQLGPRPVSVPTARLLTDIGS